MGILAIAHDCQRVGWLGFVLNGDEEEEEKEEGVLKPAGLGRFYSPRAEKEIEQRRA